MSELNRSTILCVDDDKRNLEALQAALLPEGYELILSRSGEDALGLMDHRVPDLVLLDVMMPGMSGLEVLEQIRANERLRLIPVILLTSRPQEEEKIWGIEMGCDDCLSMPFHKGELTARVRSLLRISFYRRSLDEARKLDIILEGMGDGVIICKPDWTIVRINHSAQRFLGGACGEGLNLLEVLRDRYAESVNIEHLLGARQDHQTFDLRRTESESFKALWLSIKLDTVRNRDGEIESRVLVLRDVSDKKEEFALTQDFLGLISHKLYTPIVVISEYFNYIETLAKDKEILESVAAAQKKVSALVELITRLLYVVSVRDRALNLPVPIHTLPAELAKLKQKAEAKYQKKAEMASELSGTQARLWELNVIDELMDNAYKFHKSGDLLIRIKRTDAMIEFSDNGPGIPPEEHDKIFEPFYQVYRYFTGNIPGAGMGLTLVKRLVELNKGRIEIDSAIGKGVTFKIYI